MLVADTSYNENTETWFLKFIDVYIWRLKGLKDANFNHKKQIKINLLLVVIYILFFKKKWHRNVLFANFGKWSLYGLYFYFEFNSLNVYKWLNQIAI